MNWWAVAGLIGTGLFGAVVLAMYLSGEVRK